jgi:MFS family permease
MISALGDAVHRIALALMIYEWTGSAVAVGMILLTTAVPALLLAPIVGAWLDRTDRRRAIALCDFARAPVVAVIPFLPGTGAVYACAFVASLFGFVVAAGQNVIVADLFERDRLAAVNALTKTATRLMHVVGPLVAGTVVLVGGYHAAFLLDAATFVVSALTMLAIRMPAVARSARSERVPLRPFAGWHELVRLPPVRHVAVVMAVVMVVSGAFNVLLVVHLRTTLGLPEQGYSTFMAVASGGLLVGAYLVMWLRRPSTVALLYAAVLTDGALTAALGLTRTFPVALAIGFGIGVVSGIASVASLTVLQRETPDAVRGRVFATYEMVIQSLTVVSMAGGGWVVSVIGTRPVLLGGGAFVVLVTVAVVAIRERGEAASHGRPAPDPRVVS